MPAVFEYAHTVRPDEIDALGHANNVVFLEWMQAAAVAHSTCQGWPGEAYRRLGQGWVVRSHSIEYRQPAVAGEQVMVKTWVATMKKVSSLRQFRIVRAADRETLAVAETNWAFVDYATNRPVRIPPDVAGAFEVVKDEPS
jgi:acyl-CoA thioester hydrolase